MRLEASGWFTNNPFFQSPVRGCSAVGGGMKRRIERLRAEAEDCLLISNLATDAQKEATFKSIARHLRELAADIEKLVDGAE
jgi:hypothetical protein